MVFGAASALVCVALLVLEGVWGNGYLWDGMAYLGRMAYMRWFIWDGWLIRDGLYMGADMRWFIWHGTVHLGRDGQLYR